MLGEPVIDFFPAFFILGNRHIGESGIFDTEDCHRIILCRVPLGRPKFYTQNWLDTLPLTGLYKLITAGGIVDICKYKGVYPLLCRRLSQLVGRQGPVLKRIICVAIKVNRF